MNNIIDLLPYLPQQAQIQKRERRQKYFSGIVNLIESVVTACIGTGFFLMLLAFFSTMA